MIWLHEFSTRILDEPLSNPKPPLILRAGRYQLLLNFMFEKNATDGYIGSNTSGTHSLSPANWTDMDPRTRAGPIQEVEKNKLPDCAHDDNVSKNLPHAEGEPRVQTRDPKIKSVQKTCDLLGSMEEEGSANRNLKNLKTLDTQRKTKVPAAREKAPVGKRNHELTLRWAIEKWICEFHDFEFLWSKKIRNCRLERKTIHILLTTLGRKSGISSPSTHHWVLSLRDTHVKVVFFYLPGTCNSLYEQK